MMRKTQQQSGFVLVEVLVSVILFSIGVLGLLAVHAHGSQTSTDSENRMRAAVLASQLASQLWAQDSTTATPSGYTTWQTAVANQTDAGLPNGSGTLTTGSPATISITWYEPWHGSSQKHQYVTLVQIP